MKFSKTISLPPALTIETHNLCNRKCWFCKHGTFNKKESTNWMSWDLITRIVQNLKDYNFSGRLSWYRINEPLLDRRIFEIVTYSRKELPNSFLSILTNGDLLTPQKLDALFNAGINSVGVSIYDDISYRKFQLEAFSRCVLLDRRPKKEGSFVESRGGNIKVENVFDKKNQNCFRPSTMMNVLANGDVVLCCADFYAEVKVGSLRHQRIETVWAGPLLKKYRKTLEEQGRTTLALCSQCTYHGGKHEREYPEVKMNHTL